MDWVGQKLGIPLYTYFGLDPKDAPLTTFSIGIDTPEITKQKTREAAAYPVLKVKVGLATDEPTIEAVRSVTKKPLRVDANEGWKDKEEAVRKINWLEKHGRRIHRAAAAGGHARGDSAGFAASVHIPIFADEACQRASDIPKLKEYFDGVNVKLDKSGRNAGSLPHDPDRQSARHEDHAGLHDLQFGDGDRGRAPLPAGRFRRPGRQPADLQRSRSTACGWRRAS